MSDNRQHSRFGASAAERYFACPGSVALCDKAPPLPPTPESREGTVAHMLIEQCLKNGFDPEEMVGRFIDRFEITPEMAYAVYDFVHDSRVDFVERGAQAFIEYRFSLDAFDPECWGTCDIATYFPETALLRVRDYKHGVGVFVPVESNKQIMVYGLGAMMTLGKPVKRVELCVYQPRHYGDGEPARSWEIDPGELLEFGGELTAAIEAARQPDAPLVPGDHCRFCPARGLCPALEELAIKTTGTDLIPYTGDVLVPDPPKSMPMDDLGRVLTLAPLIRTWLHGVKALACAEAMRGNVATGFKPVAMKTHRRWKDPELAARQAARVFVGDVIEDDMFTRKIITPAALERRVGKKRAENFTSAYAEKPQGFTLVPVSDKRVAIPVGPLAEFEVIGDLENVED